MYQEKRTLSRLVRTQERVWIYLDSSETLNQFYEQAHAEGFYFEGVPYSKWVAGDLIAIHFDKTMGHAPYFVYSLLSSDNIDIINYRKYAAGIYNCYYTSEDRYGKKKKEEKEHE